MKLLKNSLLFEYDPNKKVLSTFRLIEGSSDKIICTEYPLEILKEKGVKEAALLIGEDTLCALEGTLSDFVSK